MCTEWIPVLELGPLDPLVYIVLKTIVIYTKLVQTRSHYYLDKLGETGICLDIDLETSIPLHPLLSLPPLSSPLVTCTSSTFAMSQTSVSLPSHSKMVSPLTPPLPRINLAKVDQRIKKNLADRRREINFKGVCVSEEAQQLFDSLMKL